MLLETKKYLRLKSQHITTFLALYHFRIGMSVSVANLPLGNNVTPIQHE